ncbi:MAG TPA: hypothetical protein VKU41_27875 [Polyangiaceae bacterium]|nr:hypothetical protein [Polyangiaceae bacterium]
MPPRSALLAATFAALGVACGAAVRSHIEDQARRDVPIAICQKPVSAADMDPAGKPLPQLYWSVLVTGFGGMGAPLAPTATDCAGNALIPAEDVRSMVLRKAAAAEDMTTLENADGSQVVWIRAAADPHRAAGPLAVVLALPTEIDVYAIGAYAGSSQHTRFESVKVGPASFLAAYDDACADVKGDADCESTVSFYSVQAGRFDPVARATTTRTQNGTMRDIGKVVFRLSTEAPTFDDKGMHLKEKLSVRDSSDDEVRRAQGERLFTYKDGVLAAAGESVWAQVAKP